MINKCKNIALGLIAVLSINISCNKVCAEGASSSDLDVVISAILKAKNDLDLLISQPKRTIICEESHFYRKVQREFSEDKKIPMSVSVTEANTIDRRTLYISKCSYHDTKNFILNKIMLSTGGVDKLAVNGYGLLCVKDGVPISYMPQEKFSIFGHTIDEFFAVFGNAAFDTFVKVAISDAIINNPESELVILPFYKMYEWIDPVAKLIDQKNKSGVIIKSLHDLNLTYSFENQVLSVTTHNFPDAIVQIKFNKNISNLPIEVIMRTPLGLETHISYQYQSVSLGKNNFSGPTRYTSQMSYVKGGQRLLMVSRNIFIKYEDVNDDILNAVITKEDCDNIKN